MACHCVRWRAACALACRPGVQRRASAGKTDTQAAGCATACNRGVKKHVAACSGGQFWARPAVLRANLRADFTGGFYARVLRRDFTGAIYAGVLQRRFTAAFYVRVLLGARPRPYPVPIPNSRI